VAVNAPSVCLVKNLFIRADKKNLYKLTTDMAIFHTTLVQLKYDSRLNLPQTFLDVPKSMVLKLNVDHITTRQWIKSKWKCRFRRHVSFNVHFMVVSLICLCKATWGVEIFAKRW